MGLNNQKPYVLLDINCSNYMQYFNTKQQSLLKATTRAQDKF